jgi:hypothetical protein
MPARHCNSARTGGEIVNREPIPNRPGEERGTVIKNGQGYKMKVGDVVNIRR